ncbi:hypothetical protein ACSMXN_07625 [Jatrophihabitans sp. DSM 45814]
MTVLATGSYVDWGSMGKILLISIIAGAGLVTVYSVGMLALSKSGYVHAIDEGSAAGEPVRRNMAALVAAGFCGLIVAAGVAYGIYEIFAKK